MTQLECAHALNLASFSRSERRAHDACWVFPHLGPDRGHMSAKKLLRAVGVSWIVCAFCLLTRFEACRLSPNKVQVVCTIAAETRIVWHGPFQKFGNIAHTQDFSLEP